LTAKVEALQEEHEAESKAANGALFESLDPLRNQHVVSCQAIAFEYALIARSIFFGLCSSTTALLLEGSKGICTRISAQKTGVGGKCRITRRLR
jgi:hypothetical protein